MPNYINICLFFCDVMVIYSDVRKKMHSFLTKQCINRVVNLLSEARCSFYCMSLENAQASWGYVDSIKVTNLIDLVLE